MNIGVANGAVREQPQETLGCIWDRDSELVYFSTQDVLKPLEAICHVPGLDACDVCVCACICICVCLLYELVFMYVCVPFLCFKRTMAKW